MAHLPSQSIYPTMPRLLLERDVLIMVQIKGTRFCVTYNVKDTIGCLGGIKILFPLILQMDKLLHTTDLDVSVYDPYRVNTLLQLILDFLKDHKDNQEDMVRCRGFHVICFLLKQISPQHLTEPTVKLIPEIFAAIGDNDALFNDVVNFFLFPSTP